MPTLTKAELALAINQKIGLNKRESKALVELFFAEIADLLAEGTTVKLSGFGTFSTRSKHERPGRNPKTGEDIAITARTIVTFKSGSKLRDLTADAPPKNAKPTA